MKCPRCNGHNLYRDFDGVTCLACGHIILDREPESLGQLWREAHAPSVGIPPSIQREIDKAWTKPARRSHHKSIS